MISEHARRDMAYLANAIAPNARAEERDALLKALLLAPGQIVLEAGAWDGYLATALTGQNVDITLVDRTPDGVDRLRKTFPSLRVFEGLQERLPVVRNSVDRVASLVALHHINAVAFVREAHRVLMPEGRLAIVEVGRGSRVAAFLDSYVDVLTKPRGHRGIYFSPSEWVGHLEGAGFVNVSVEYVPVRWRFSMMSQAIEYCRCVFGLSPEVTSSQISAAIETLDPKLDATGLTWEWPLIVATGDVGPQHE